MILGSLHITKSTLVTFFAIVLAMLSAVACETVEPTPFPNPTNVDLRSILDLRDSNEVAADAKYIGMYVRMEGIVSEIHEKDISIIPFGSDSFQMSGAKCKLDGNQLTKLVTLRKDEAVTVDGLIKKISDFMITTIELKPCTISVSNDASNASSAPPQPVTAASWTKEAISGAFITPDDFPDGWQVSRDSDALTIRGTHVEFMTAKKIDIDFEIFDTPEEAKENFEQRKESAESTIYSRGISGDELEDIKHDEPMFVWMLRGNKNYGSESYEALGVTGNVFFRVYNYGSMSAADKNFAIKIAKTQMDKILRTPPPEVVPLDPSRNSPSTPVLPASQNTTALVTPAIKPNSQTGELMGTPTRIPASTPTAIPSPTPTATPSPTPTAIPSPTPTSTPSPTPTATPLSYYLEGIRLHQLGFYDAAISTLTEAIKLDRNNADAYKLRGSSYLELGNYKLAISDLSEAEFYIQDDMEIYRMRGFSRNALGIYHPAVSDYNKVISTVAAPQISDYHNRGVAHYNTDSFWLAITDFTQTLQVEPTAERYELRGVSYYQTGAGVLLAQYQKAISDLDQAIRMEPTGHRYAWRSLAYSALDLTGQAEQDTVMACSYDRFYC